MAGPTRWTANLVVSLTGITAAQFNTMAQENFKSEVASSAGSICGTSGTSVCAGSDVTISSFSRRTTSVTFTLVTYSQTKANTAVTTLRTAMAAASFAASLTARGGALASVMNVTVITSSTSLHTTSTSSSSSDSSTTIIIVVVVVVVALAGVAAAVALLTSKAAPVAASAELKPLDTHKEAGMVPTADESPEN